VSELDYELSTALAEHLIRGGEESLSRAYELGREALRQGFGLFDLLTLYDGAHRELVLSAPPAEQARVAMAVANFFRELMSPFEMSFRGYREANAELKRLNADLRTAYSELQTQQMQLIQSAKMASLGELVAGVAHEINNPLSFSISHLDTARRNLNQFYSALDQAPNDAATERWERASSRLREMTQGLDRIRALVVNLRSFSRLDEGERKLVSVRECVESVLLILSHRFGDRITVKTEFGEPEKIDCFPALLNQGLMNLISNAIDAVAERGSIEIRAGQIDEQYVITVADSGSGIPEAIRDRVVNPFFTTKPVGQGTGLGLPITYSIVKKHGGTLVLRDRAGGGTEACISIPLM